MQLDQPAHVAQLERIVAAANARHMAIVVHMRANYGLPLSKNELTRVAANVAPYLHSPVAP